MQSPIQNAISTRGEYYFLHQQDSFENPEWMNKMKEYPLHIYMICKCPKIFIDNKKTEVTESSINLTFFTNIEEKRKEFSLTTINHPDRLIAKIETKYPHNVMYASRPDGSFHSEAKANLALRQLASQNSVYFEELDFEVLYVGQAFGKDGKRITIDRLKSHEKAQKIFFDTQNKFPDYEVWFLSLTIVPELYTMYKPAEKLSQSKLNKIVSDQRNVEQNPISLNQLITITEASLIKYFNTYEYNKEYLNYPSKEHKSYDECYKMDFNSTSFELCTESIYTRLWSKSIEPKSIHHRNFFLHNGTDRKDMFKWFE